MKEGARAFNISIKKNQLYISVVGALTSATWGNSWGDVISQFDKNLQYSIVVDFCKCFSSEPSILMAMILELIKQKEDKGKKVKIILPHLEKDDKEKTNYAKGSFLKFLATQGFLNIMCSKFDTGHNYVDIDEVMIKKYADYRNALPFYGDVIFPAQIYLCNDVSQKEIIVSDILQEIEFRLKSLMPLDSYRNLLEQVYNTVSELVENAITHAYASDKPKRFCIYIRRRTGFLNEALDDFKRTRLEEEIKRERKSNIVHDDRLFFDSNRILEIFFSDNGMGLTSSLKSYFEQRNKQYQYPVKELFWKVLKNGIRKDTKDSLTPYGGLHYICRLIGECKGFISCNEGKEWVSASCLELINSDDAKAKARIVDNNNGNYPRGLNWRFSIPYGEKKKKNTFSYYWKNQFYTHPVYIAYRKYCPEMELNNVLCIDECKESICILNGEYTNWKKIDINDEGSIKDVILPNNSTFVLIPKGIISKNEICRKLKKYATIIRKMIRGDKARIRMIIADIDPYSLFGYYYSIEGVHANTIGFDEFESCTLITKNWHVVYMSVSNGIIGRNKDKEAAFYTNTDEDVPIYSGIVSYAYFIRMYDSFSFWKLIEKHHADKIYIKAEVEWGNKVINDYLDLERAYLYEDLYDVVENALLRTVGFSYDTGVEYRSVDQTSRAVCQNINAKKTTEVDNAITVNVCGISVTGYTMASDYKENTPTAKINLFMHPDAPQNKMLSTCILFFWPSRDFFKRFKLEKERYYRLGKTSLIATKKEEQLIFPEKKNHGVVRSKSEKYQDLQIDHPTIIKYGHYKSDNHHYLIGFDYISFIRFSYREKRGIVPFFIWKILYYLRGERIVDICDAIVDREWAQVIATTKYYKDSNHGEMVLYHSNTVTEYLLKLVKGLLIPSVAEKIIPVSLYEIQKKGSPVTLSPFVIKLINELFEDKNKRGILFVDSSFSTGRKMIEVENILLASGAKKVSFLSIADMRRLRNGDSKNESYWKVNIPRLDDGHCVICETIKRIEGFKNKITQEESQRVSEWIRNWNCMNINNNAANHGIETEGDISYESYENGEKVSIQNTTALNLYTAEAVCESFNNDYVYKFINQHSDLKAEIRIQLICTQVLLFGNQNSRQLQLTLLSELIGLMTKIEICNTYTSLAALVIISQSETVIYELLNELLNCNTTKKILSIKDAMLKTQNMDLIIAIGYFVESSYLVEQLLNGLDSKYVNDKSYPFVEKINELALPNGSMKYLFKEFEGLYINELGSRHNTNSQKFKAHTTDFEEFNKRSKLLLNDMDRLCELIKIFPVALVSSRGSVAKDYHHIRELVRNVHSKIDDRINDYQLRIASGEEVKRFEADDAILQAIKECEVVFDSVIENYYISYSDKVIEYFNEMVNSCINRYGKEIELSISIAPELKDTNKYYYWNQSIEKEFAYLLENVEHCEEKIDKDSIAVMRVSIYFNENEIMITLDSWSDKLAVQVKDKFLGKNRLSKEQAIAFDVIFDFNNLPDNGDGLFFLTAKMSVPACYERLQGGLR